LHYSYCRLCFRVQGRRLRFQELTIITMLTPITWQGDLMLKRIDKVGKPRSTVLGIILRIEIGVTGQKGQTELDLILVGAIMILEGLIDGLDPVDGRMMKGELSFWMTIWE